MPSNSIRRWIVALCLFLYLPCLAHYQTFTSGLFREIAVPTPPQKRLTDQAAVNAFLEHQYNAWGIYRWRSAHTVTDDTHIHHLFYLYYGERRVLDHYLNLHYNREGFIQYGQSSWNHLFFSAIPTREQTQRATQQVKDRLMRRIISERGHFDGRIVTEPVIWTRPFSGEAVNIIDVKVDLYRPMEFHHYLYEESSGKLIREIPVLRYDVQNHVYLVDPFNGGSDDANPDLLSLPNLLNTTSLESQFVHVRREQNYPTGSFQEVDPTHDFTQDTGTDGFHTGDTAPNNYDYECNGASDSCSDIGFDAVNVYFHINTYRNHIQAYLSQLGISPTDSTDPIDVIVNAFTINSGSGNSSPSNESNNATYVPRPCTSDGSMPRCITFLRPASLFGVINCNTLTAQFYDLARESTVIVHEYQHYITESITHMQFSSGSAVSVGDALHEGYSDYFGASETSYLAGQDVTTIGEYGFQQCPYFERNVGVLKPYDNSDSAVQDPHISGLTWASGLWQLRKELGKDAVDLLALKSQTFLSPQPGFIEAVESLVKADISLNGGSHVSGIRDLFYNQLKFLGSASNPYTNTTNGSVDVGFHSCSSSHNNHETKPVFVFLLGLFWLGGLIAVGRLCKTDLKAIS